MPENDTIPVPPSQPTTQSTPTQPVASPAPHEAPRADTAPNPAPDYELGPQPAWSDRPPNGTFRDKLRTPAVAALAGAVIVFGVGFGAGYVVGHDRGEQGTTTQNGPGGGFGGRGGFGGPGGGFGPNSQQNGTGQNGQQMPNFGGQAPGQANPGTAQQGTTGSTT